MRYVMRIAKPSESSKFWTQLALPCEACLLECLFYPHRRFKFILSDQLQAPAVDGHFFLRNVRSHAQMKHHFRSSLESSQHDPGITFFDDRRRNHSFLWRDFTPNSSREESIHGSFGIGPPIRQDYPLNLSILISGGKETNQDSPSNCEWSGRSSDWKSSEL